MKAYGKKIKEHVDGKNFNLDFHTIPHFGESEEFENNYVPTRGKVYFDNKDLSKLDERELSKLRRKKIGFILSADNVLSIMEERFYDGMEGGILEAMGKLFASDSKMLVFPNLTPDGQLLTAENVEVPDSQKYLYRHLLHNRRLIPLKPDLTRLVPFVSKLSS